MRRAYAIGVLDSIEDTLKVHMYWRNVQGLRVKASVVCCLLFGTFVPVYSRWVHLVTLPQHCNLKGATIAIFLNFMFEMPLGTFKLGPLSRFFIGLTFVPEYRRKAARYIKINDTTIILRPKVTTIAIC